VLERILPAEVAVVASREDRTATLFPAEEMAIARAVEKRRREYVTARACAREALGRLGVAARPILNGARGEPLWPAGIVGSITPCGGYRVCAVARAAEVLTIGVDAETDEPLPGGLIGDVALPEERQRIEALARQDPAVSWDRLLFCAKESVYKAWYPLTESWLGFEDATVTIDRARGTFAARLLVPGPSLAGGQLTRFEGRWLADEGLLVAAIAVMASDD
jgi:4'-phosphopantetheinyl transferase EntD